MKLRFENNSMRLRLKKSELLRFKENGFVQDVVTFPNAALTYSLHIKNVQEVATELSINSIAINIPEHTAHSWISTNAVGIYETVQLPDRSALSIMIEKDFPCRDRPGEDSSDTFTELADKSETGELC